MKRTSHNYRQLARHVQHVIGEPKIYSEHESCPNLITGEPCKTIGRDFCSWFRKPYGKMDLGWLGGSNCPCFCRPKTVVLRDLKFVEENGITALRNKRRPKCKKK